MSWREQARCSGKTRIFFSSEYHSIRAAKELCGECPVTRECLRDALIEDSATFCELWSGVRGGMTAKERANLWRSHPEVRAAIVSRAVA